MGGGASADLDARSHKLQHVGGVTVGQTEGDFPALTAAWLGGSAAVWSLIVRREGGWEVRRREGGWLQ